ncbi:T9SS type A sorting domain-containing protein [Hymenobacter sp. ASUV-10]|uniref:T9SS type A sorting domain-containing protein n=1 Tax=Hymenobacter aranciens TaxID=3063996 RepID=A0ABT9B6R2_9BACT|nr:T9SS type A sorting domain-containing protein [Hymenobacter sp. ASUV-10]MDO7873960.1 T9SS type A sorting domain-containing protein [Hymenobacter sp. ASUV-10]
MLSPSTLGRSGRYGLAVAALVLSSQLTQAQTQTPVYVGPDASFGTNGSVNTGVSGRGGRFSDVSTAQHDDWSRMGQLVQAQGYLWVCNGSQLQRYSLDGVADAAFGTNGTVTVPFVASGLTVQADGKVLVVGYITGGFYNSRALARYTAAGVLDPTFGTAGVVADPNNGPYVELRRVVQLASGEYLAFGVPATGSGYGSRVLRLSATGQPVGQLVSVADAWLDDIAVQADGQIIVIGCTFGTTPNATPGISVRRYTATGNPDTSFGTNGNTVINGIKTFQGVTGPGFTEGYGVAVQPADGKIVLAGRVWVNNRGDQPVLLRLNADGTPDTAFNTAAAQSISVVGGLRAVAVQPDGAIVVGGGKEAWPSREHQLLLARYTAAGRLDSTFTNAADKLYMQGMPSAVGVASSLVLQTGKVVTLGGFETNDPSTLTGVMRLARYVASVPAIPTATRAASSVLGLQASPVPSHGLVQLHYSLPRAAAVRYTVHDQMGRPVPGLAAERRQAAGLQEQTLDLRTLAAGVYLCTVEAGGYRQTLRLVVAP